MKWLLPLTALPVLALLAYGFRVDHRDIPFLIRQGDFPMDEPALRARGVVKGRHDDGVKILGDGELTKPLIVHAAKFSESAAAKLAAAGGQAVVA